MNTLVRDACALVMERDVPLLATTERVVVARLLVYLDRAVRQHEQLHDYDVDFEYERAGVNVKGFAGRRAQDADGIQASFRRKIVPDLLIHKRTVNDATSNLLAIEVKTDPDAGLGPDQTKLTLMTDPDAWAAVYPVGVRGGTRLALGRGPRPRDIDTAALPHVVHPYAHGVLIDFRTVGQFPALQWFHRRV
ncbi:hypothetical protein [Nocardioides sp.]|uniref:hypothetical protein n=1 Tax=Nocardioides sp. TaxID=35761 RepID=UPI0035ADA8CF